MMNRMQELSDERAAMVSTRLLGSMIILESSFLLIVACGADDKE